MDLGSIYSFELCGGSAWLVSRAQTGAYPCAVCFVHLFFELLNLGGGIGTVVSVGAVVEIVILVTVCFVLCS